MSKDVLSEVAMLRGAAVATPAETPKGLYKIIEVNELEAHAQLGWRPLRTIETQHLVADREDVATPPNGQTHHSHGHCQRREIVFAGKAGSYGHEELSLFASDDPRVLSLIKTRHVQKTMFVVFLDEDSALALMDKRLAGHMAAAREARQSACAAVDDLAAEKKKHEETAGKLSRAQHEHSRSNESYNVQVARNRSMEQDLGKLRQDYKKLEAALGALKVKEILGQ